MPLLIDYPQCDLERVEVAGINPIPDAVIVDGRRVQNRFPRAAKPPRSETVKSIHIDVKLEGALVTLVREVVNCVDGSSAMGDCHMAFTVNTTRHVLTHDDLASARIEIERARYSGALVTERCDVRDTPCGVVMRMSARIE